MLDKQMTLLSPLLLYIWCWPQALSSYHSQGLREEACLNNLLSYLSSLLGSRTHLLAC